MNVYHGEIVAGKFPNHFTIRHQVAVPIHVYLGMKMVYFSISRCEFILAAKVVEMFIFDFISIICAPYFLPLSSRYSANVGVILEIRKFSSFSPFSQAECRSLTKSVLDSSR